MIMSASAFAAWASLHTIDGCRRGRTEALGTGALGSGSTSMGDAVEVLDSEDGALEGGGWGLEGTKAVAALLRDAAEIVELRGEQEGDGVEIDDGGDARMRFA